MDLKQLEALLSSGESETLEFKKTTGERQDAMHALCAMLNHRGGRILFGVEPDRRATGQQVSDHTIEVLAQEIQRIDPPAFPTIERIEIGPDREIVVVSTSPGQNGPYVYKGQAFRRVGNTSLQMSRDEYNRPNRDQGRPGGS